MHHNFCKFFCIFTFYNLLHFALVYGQSKGDLRLSFGYEGLLEIYYDGWGYVCDVGWDSKDSNVACRSLGFGSAVSYQTHYYHPNYTREFKISDVNCTGFENNILECGYSMTLSSCYYYRHVFLDCRLDHCQSYLHMPDNSAQVVQYFNGQNWFYICKYNFSEENAHVICYENYGTEALNYSYVKNNTLITFDYSFYPYRHVCRGSEASLCNCPIVNQTCQSMEAVVIECGRPDYGTIRLTNNADSLLQIYINSRWIYVCTFVEQYYGYSSNYNVFLSDAMDIACRELGFSKARSFRLNFDDPYFDDYRLLLGTCAKYDAKISNCTYNLLLGNFHCPSRISLSCETDTCNVFLQLNEISSNSFQLAQTYTDKSWFYICFDDFTQTDANVICKETSFASVTSFQKVPLDHLLQQRPISPYNYSCAGNESTLCSCPAERSTCESKEVVNLLCDEPNFGTIRISNGYYGYIEVYTGEWRRVCGYTFNSLVADIICRSAGYRKVNYFNIYYYYYFYYYSSAIKSIQSINCFGNETALLDCSYTNYTICYAQNTVTCLRDGCQTFLNNPESLEAVKIYNNQQWYSLCEDEFTQQTADIICRENHGSNASQYYFQTIQPANYPIYPFYLKCDGNENSVCACNAIPHTCSSDQIVYVECKEPSNGHLRLSNGTSGTLEVYLSSWKRVCGYYINQATSNVVCRYLGYRDAVTFSYINSGNLGYSPVSYLCLGNETNILECQHNTYSTCRYTSYISCRTEGCQSYIPEEHTTNEPVRFYTNEDWYYLCANFISTKEANVICRENGFLNGAQSIMSMLRSQLSISFEIFPYNISCQGDESSLCNCSMIQSQCQDNNIAVIRCFAPVQGTLRYSDQYRNLLEIYYNGGWNQICYYNWGYTDSAVACRQLGYTRSNGYSVTTTRNIATSYPNTFGNVKCIGNESSLINCGYKIANCQSYNSHKVILYCTRGDCEVQAPFATDNFQIVEYFADNLRYYLCADDFTDENADVVCRETSNTLSISHRNAGELNLPPNTHIYPFQHSCFGNEYSLCNCSTYLQSCTSGLVVEVQCGTPAFGTIRDFSIGNYLQVYSEGWKYICRSSFNGQEATVACRQQGFRTYRYWDSRNSNGGTYWNRNLNCRGNETKLLDCSYTSISNCNKRLILICEIDNCDSILINGDQTPVPVRYYDGHANYYLCKEGFTVETANVVCHREGYGDVMTIGETQPNNTGFNYAISNRVYTCNGNEYSICNCSFLIQKCESGNIAKFQCKKPEQGRLRFSTRNTLQLYYNHWRDICYQRWDTTDSDVACRQLGYRYANSFERSSHHYNANGYLSDVICIGNETRVIDCKYHLSRYCLTSGYFGVLLTCYSGGCQSYAPDASSFPQIVRYYTNGWNYLCRDGFTRENADVVCRENEGTLSLSFSNISYADINSDIQMLEKKFECTGREKSLCDCASSTALCPSNTVVKLQCNPPAYGHIRLSNRDEGILEIYLNRWGYVCDDGWNRAASEVVCSQLGLELLTSFKTGVEVNNLLYPFLLDDVKCYGNESSLFECSHTFRHDCQSGEHVSITCTTPHTSTGVAPIIIFPNMNITKTINGTEADIASIECLAIGDPAPEVYWTRDFEERFVDSPTLQISITDLANGGKVFYCVAQNSVGKVVVSVTYKIVLTTEDVQEAISDVMKELNNTESISDEMSGQAADKTKVIIDSVNENVDIKGENKSKLLESAATTTALIVNKTNGTFSNETTEKITGLLSSIVLGSSDIEESDTETETQQGEQSTVATIPAALAITLITLERFSQRLSVQLKDTEVNTVRIVESQLITIVVQNVALDNSDDNNETKAKIILPIKSSDDVQYSVMIELSIDLALTLSTDGKSLAIATSIVKRIESTDSDSSETKQGSDILTIAIAGKSGTVELSQKVTLSFDVYSSKPSESICVFLNSTSWVSNGLVTEQKTFNFTNCESKHFTSFAVFVTPHKNNKPYSESIALSVISYLFVGISFISLLISLILFIAAGKPFFKVETNIIYFNYCLSMLLATGLFIFGIQVGTYNLKLCKTIAFLLHYSWLAVFTWTLCIGILVMYKIVISVLSTRKIYIYLIAFGWIFPIIIPIITIAFTRDYYVDSNSHCFLNIAGGVIWSFIAPIFIIIIINAVFLIISLIRIIQTKSANQNEETRDIIKSALITGLVLTPVLGLPWLFLLFNIAIRHSALEWIFIIINGLMGLIFLLVVVIRNKEVVALFKKNKETASTNTHPSPRHAMSSSATGSTFTSNRFKKTNTLERQLVKESEIEAATIEPYGVYNSPYSTTENTYEVDSEEKKTFEAGMSEQTSTGYENPIYSSIGDAPDDPPVYQNLSKLGMVTEIHTNPMYMQSPVPAQGYTNELYADVTELNESNAFYSDETQLVDD